MHLRYNSVFEDLWLACKMLLAFIFYAFTQADSSVMCAQTIFTVLDYLSAWAVGKKRAAAIRRMRNQPQRGVKIQSLVFFDLSHVVCTC